MSEGWAMPIKAHKRAKYHYYRPGRDGRPKSLCYQRSQRTGFVPLDHTPPAAACCKVCLRYVAVPVLEGVKP